MNGYDFYKMYNAIKLHFQTEKYNFFTFDGNVKISVEAFERRKDKYIFHKMAKLYKEDEAVSFLVSNFLEGNADWSRKLVHDEAKNIFINWKKRTEAMRETFKSDLDRVLPEKNAKEFNGLFEVDNGQFPKLFSHLLQKDVSVETIVILNNIFNFIKIWDKKIDDTIIYPKYSLKIRKYGSFLNVDVNKYKEVLKNYLTS